MRRIKQQIVVAKRLEMPDKIVNIPQENATSQLLLKLR
jgi:hypothetical protein